MLSSRRAAPGATPSPFLWNTSGYVSTSFEHHSVAVPMWTCHCVHRRMSSVRAAVWTPLVGSLCLAKRSKRFTACLWSGCGDLVSCTGLMLCVVCLRGRELDCLFAHCSVSDPSPVNIHYGMMMFVVSFPIYFTVLLLSLVNQVWTLLIEGYALMHIRAREYFYCHTLVY